jgi:predicted  nucleic acid-binding Zn-ribbon protein
LSNTVEKLWELQQQMSELVETERGLQNKPPEYAELESRYKGALAEVDSLTASITELGKKRRDLEGDLQQEQELLKKFQGQLMQVKNQQQYAAAWKEIDVARKKVKELEDEALKQMAEIEEKETLVATRRTELETLREEHDQAYEEWQSSLGDLREKAAAIKQKVAAAEQGIPDRYRREFHQVFKARQGVAVTPIIDGSCGGCRVRIRPQVVQQLKRGEVVTCEGCRRFLHTEVFTTAQSS